MSGAKREGKKLRLKGRGKRRHEEWMTWKKRNQGKKKKRKTRKKLEEVKMMVKHKKRKKYGNGKSKCRV